jgi:hypothetical protein
MLALGETASSSLRTRNRIIYRCMRRASLAQTASKRVAFADKGNFREGTRIYFYRTCPRVMYNTENKSGVVQGLMG